MSDAISTDGSAQRRVRIWPALLIVAFIWAAIMLPARIVPDSQMIPFMAVFFGTMGAAAFFCAWWIFASRVSWADVLLGIAAVAVGIGCLKLVGHESMGFYPILFYLVPI